MLLKSGCFVYYNDQLGLDLRQPISLWKIILPLLIIPLIGLTFVYFGKFHPTGKTAEDEKKRAEPEIKEPPHPDDIAKDRVKQEKKLPAQEKPGEQQEQEKNNHLHSKRAVLISRTISNSVLKKKTI